MLISHKYKFIFIKVHKTAGTSIQVELARIMADDDIFVPKILNNPKAPKFYRRIKPYIQRISPHGLKRWLLPYEPLLHPHMSARHVKKYIGAEVFNSYFKFCVEREPVDKCVSRYWWLKRNPNYSRALVYGNMSWECFLEKRFWPVSAHLWTDEAGDLMVDRILRYENLNEEMRQVGRELGFHIEMIGARHKKGTRRPGIKVSEEQREMIYQAFAESNRHTGYRIEDCKLT